MADALEPAPVKLFCGLIYAQEEAARLAENLLASSFGLPDLRSGPFLFNHTRYYEREMGAPLYRLFLGFQRLVDPGELAEIKTHTNRLEKRLSLQGRRSVNLDPGYLTLSKVVLATTKDYGHRVYLKEGIYAEVTLRFEQGAFHPLPWTYPDYRQENYLRFFSALRGSYRRQRQAAGVG